MSKKKIPKKFKKVQIIPIQYALKKGIKTAVTCLMKEKNSSQCCKCSFIAIEMRNNRQVWGIDSDGREDYLSRDHIIPKSKGGLSCSNNLQLMCSRCNGKKSNKYFNQKKLFLIKLSKVFFGISIYLTRLTYK